LGDAPLLQGRCLLAAQCVQRPAQRRVAWLEHAHRRFGRKAEGPPCAGRIQQVGYFFALRLHIVNGTVSCLRTLSTISNSNSPGDNPTSWQVRQGPFNGSNPSRQRVANPADFLGQSALGIDRPHPVGLDACRLPWTGMNWARCLGLRWPRR